MPADALVAAHGNFDTASVIDGGPPVPIDELRQALVQGEAGMRELVWRHGGLVKPDIVFFGEELQARFRALLGAADAVGRYGFVPGSPLATSDPSDWVRIPLRAPRPPPRGSERERRMCVCV